MLGSWLVLGAVVPGAHLTAGEGKERRAARVRTKHRAPRTSQEPSTNHQEPAAAIVRSGLIREARGDAWAAELDVRYAFRHLG